MISSGPIVIIGAGHAGFQLALSLRQNGFAGSIRLINNETHLPYQRPPLSKTYLKGTAGPISLAFRPEAFFAQHGIELIPAEATAIDRAAQIVRLSSGASLPYQHLVFATGAQNRQLPLANAASHLHYIRNLDDAEFLRGKLAVARRVTVIGAGFIGLEFAAMATAQGLMVDVVELGSRAMERAVTAEISEFFRCRHEQAGMTFHFGVQAIDIEATGETVETVVLSNGKRLASDLVVVGIGIKPHTDLAAAAGLTVADGIVVDHHLSTSDPAISAIGDGALFPTPHAKIPIRLESVQNATDQARCVASRLTGKILPYQSVPWFWSDQGSDKLQIVGLTRGVERTVLRGTPDSGSFSVFCYAGDRLLGIESVNRASDHVAGRKILDLGRSIAPEAAADPGFNLKTLVS